MGGEGGVPAGGDGGGGPRAPEGSGAPGTDEGPTPDGALRAELDEESLVAWGRRLGEAATARGAGPGVLVALTGPLGAGKTTLVRAACRGAGVEGKVRSPTFTLHNHHRPRGRRPIHHVDLYRLSGPEDLDDLGWDELVDAGGVVFVEWAERAGDRLPPDRWEIRLEPAGDPSARRVEARRLGQAPPLPRPPAADGLADDARRRSEGAGAAGGGVPPGRPGGGGGGRC